MSRRYGRTRLSELHTSEKNYGLSPGLAAQVSCFAGFLRSRGYKAFQSNVMDALRGLEEVDLSSRRDFSLVLRANLSSTDLEWAQFSELFNEFWSSCSWNKTGPERKGPPVKKEPRNEAHDTITYPDIEPTRSAEAERFYREIKAEGGSYSPVSGLMRKDLSTLEKGEIHAARLSVKRLTASFKIHESRRQKKTTKRGSIDFPKVMRSNLKHNGVPVRLYYKEKKKRLKRFVVLSDVSGSMDRYARFVLPFIMGIKGLGSKAEVFVFSTSLTAVTPFLRHMTTERALQEMSKKVPDWSGGTRIGYSLHQFNERQGQRLLSRRTVVVILSDGWDLGAKDMLRREMERLSSSAYCVVWLNPLAEEQETSLIYPGMRIALRYVDYFLPANSLQSLKKVAKVLSKLMVH